MKKMNEFEYRKETEQVLEFEPLSEFLQVVAWKNRVGPSF